MANLVVASFDSPAGDYCVDIFRRDDGSYGLEEFRRDAEDLRGWFSLHRHSRLRFATSDDALAHAKAAVAWLGVQWVGEQRSQPSAAPLPLPRQGAKTVLRRLEPADLRDYQGYRGDADVGRYQGCTPQSDAAALEFIEEMHRSALFHPGAWTQLGIAERDTNRLIGDVGVRVANDGASVELGFTVSASYQGKGFAMDAAGEAIGLVFEHTSASKLVCTTDARNAACIRLLERLGMHRTISAEAVFRGEPCVEHSYVLMREGH